MGDQPAALDDALEQVVTAARLHLAAIKAAEGASDDEDVWRSYVALNNASFTYDKLLLESYGEVTPWDNELIEVGTAGERFLTAPDVPIGEDPGDPYPSVLSVRQRRDFRVPSVTALLAAAQAAAARLASGVEVGPQTVAGAVRELIGEGDGSLASLDLPVLEPLGGVVTITEVAQAMDPTADGAELFRLGAGDRMVGRLDEPVDPPAGDTEPVDPPAGGEEPAGAGS